MKGLAGWRSLAQSDRCGDKLQWCSTGFVGRFIFTMICLLAMLPAGNAQQGRGSIQGTVTDSSGAAVPGASVTVVNQGTNVKFVTKTSGEGYYVAPALPVGIYSVSAEKQGFKRVVRNDLTLQVDQRADIDLTLTVGSASESVTVTAEAPVTDTASATVGKVIENKRIQELPINGRNALSLVLLAPAVKSQAPGNANGFADRGIALSAISINGGPSALNNFVLDGGNNNQGYLADVNANPTVDAVQEFKVQSNVMSAEFGFTAGGVVNIVTKSGTNQYHGTAYEFLRNEKLDARNTFNATRPPFRYNQFGGALGGPLSIPKLYKGQDRTFYFYNYEDWRYRRTTQPITTVPTLGQRLGDFSDLRDATGKLITIYDPTTTRRVAGVNGVVRDPFPNNVIPPSQLDSAAKAFLQFYPLPNRTPTNAFTNTNNYLSTIKESRDMQQHTAKVDHRFNDTNSLFVRYVKYTHFTDGSNNTSNPWPDPLVRARYDNLQNQNGVVSDTHTFSPTLLNEFRVSVSRSYFPFQAASFGQDLPRKLGLPASIPSDTLPLISNGLAGFGAFTVGLRGSLTWQFLDMITLIKGGHTIKLGYDHRLNRANNYQRETPSYSFTFPAGLTQNPQSQAGTGSAFASFLLGQVGSASAVRYLGESESAYSASVFAQDDWKVTRRFTLNLGLRWDYQQWPRERYNGLTNFDPNGLIPNTNLRGRTTYAGQDFGRSPYEPVYTNFAPRVGFAYDVFGNGKTVVRGGYAIFYPSTFYRDTFGSTQGFANTSTAYAPTGGDTNFAAFNFASGLPFDPIAPQGRALGAGAFLGQGVTLDQANEKVPMSQQWNLSLQQDVKGWLMEATYTANKADHLVAGSYTINDIPLDAYSQGLALQNQVPNPYAGQVTGSLGGATITRLQSLRPFPYYNTVTVRNPHLGSSNYHALILTAERRFSKGLVLLASYTKGKVISDSVVTPVNFGPGIEQVTTTGYQNGQYDRRAERSIDPTDIAQRFVLSGVYELPFGKGKLLDSHNGVVNRVIGGWQINSIFTAQSGVPLTIRGASNNRADRPNSTGVSARIDNPTAARWFDTTQFVNPAPFTLGNVGRTLADVRAPGLQNIDLSLIKDTQLWESGRLQFRAEAFNVANRVNLGLPNMSFSPGPDGKNNNAAFGTIVNARDARIVQLGLKLIF